MKLFAGASDARSAAPRDRRVALQSSRLRAPARGLHGGALPGAAWAAEDVDVAWVPGAFEIPQTARALADTRRYDAIIALGVVIRGGTPSLRIRVPRRHRRRAGGDAKIPASPSHSVSSPPTTSSRRSTAREASTATRGATPRRRRSRWRACFPRCASAPEPGRERPASAARGDRAGSRSRCSTPPISRLGERARDRLRTRRGELRPAPRSARVRQGAGVRNDGRARHDRRADRGRTRATGGSTGWPRSIATCSGSRCTSCSTPTRRRRW